MEVPTHEQIVDAIDAFLARHQMAPTRFGAEATRDANLVNDLRTGKRSPRLTLLHKIKEFMDARDAASEANSEHAAAHTSSAARVSCGTETSFSADRNQRFAAEGEGVTPLSGGACA